MGGCLLGRTQCAPTGLRREPIVCTDFALLIHRERSPFPAGEGLVCAPLHNLVRSRFAFFMATHTVANYSFSRCLRFYENYRQNRVFAKQNGVVRRQAFCWARHSNFTYTPNYTRCVVVTRGAVEHNLRGSSGFNTDRTAVGQSVTNAEIRRSNIKNLRFDFIKSLRFYCVKKERRYLISK